MLQQTFSFICLKFLDLQPYDVATPERLICTVQNWEHALTEMVITFECNASCVA